MSDLSWQESFKPETKNTGEEIFANRLVTLVTMSDTSIDALVKVAGQPKVQLRSGGVGSGVFFADCTCSSSLRGQLCKHIWAALLQTQVKYPDFLVAKMSIEKSQKNAVASEQSPLKAKQAEYKKQQYEKYKQRAKEIRRGKSLAKSKGEILEKLPTEVKESMDFFADNGFPLPWPIPQMSLKEAKKSLSRVFHPDKGGSHAEVLELHRHYDVLISYANF